MSRNTLSFSLPETMRSYIDARVTSVHYGNTSEYVRDLIRKDQREQRIQRLRALVEEGLASGSGRADTPADWTELRANAVSGIE